MRLIQNILNMFKLDSTENSCEIAIHTNNSEKGSYSHTPNAEYMLLTTIKAFWRSSPRKYPDNISDATIEEYLLYGKTLMLNLFANAYPLQDRFPVYFQYECHLSNPKKLQYELLQNDYLKPAPAYMVLESYRVPELKMLAESIGCSKSGKKQELIDRIYTALDSESRQQLISQADLYVLSSKGKAFLEGNDDYLELHRHANYNIPLSEFNRNRFPDGQHRRTFNDNIYTLLSERVYKNCVQRIFHGMEHDHKILFDIAMSEYRYDIALDHYLRFLYLESCCVSTAQYYASDFHMVAFNPDSEIIFTVRSAEPVVELAEYFSPNYIETIYMDLSLPPSFLTQQEFTDMINDMIESTVFDFNKYNKLIVSKLTQFSVL